MARHHNLLALSILSITSLVHALPENLGGRTPPDSHTCACLPSPESTKGTATTVLTTTETETATVTRETITEAQTLTLTITRSPVTETVHESSVERVTVTCTETITEGSDGELTTKTKPPGPDEHTKTSSSDGGSETKPPHHDDDPTTTRTSPGGSRTTPPHQNSETMKTATETATGTVPTSSGGGDSDPTSSGGGGDQPSHTDDTIKPEPTSSKDHCKHWDGTSCVKPTTTPEPPVTVTTPIDAHPTESVCPVSIAIVTVYNTITATVYQGGSASSPSTGPARVPRAPTGRAAY
ncbi:hypothetical protein CMUS01_13276 [Colletotrichum musicola]|uniref:Uncharacterized protein n=1 Tax=Colletotrichum musicola TaxID=2175873 RepID=A0A8H6MX08_9PEZI|nr:hypothetical protein CMUS01_13276 [Colletotrichum musicola]